MLIMFSITNKYNQNSDFQAILSSGNSKLNIIKHIIDLKSANNLRDRASNNKRGITFVSKIINSKFKNIFFFNVSQKIKNDYLYQDIGGAIICEAINLKKKSINIFLDSLPNSLLKESIIKNILIGLISRNYNFKNYKIIKEKKIISKINIITSKRSLAKRCVTYALNINGGVFKTRDLVTTPPNILNPKQFSNEIKKLNKYGLKVEIFDEKKLSKIGMNALLGVGRGSTNRSYVAIMKWNGGKKNSKPLSFIGKGVCFDTGGISLKPARFMEEMKYDMAGAGTVVGLMKTLAMRKAKINAVGVVGLVENMPDGNAQRPGDVVKSYSGKTIEILNTDAEGRLVLADLLTYTEKRFKPKFMINLATLTGAIIISLGNEYAGLFSNNDQLADRINKTSYKDNEKAWRLPLNKNFDQLIDSQIADVQNINYSGGAGSITAAQFLQRFVLNKTPWAHLDIAGMAWTKKNSKTIPAGATGYGVKLLNRLVEEYYE